MESMRAGSSQRGLLPYIAVFKFLNEGPVSSHGVCRDGRGSTLIISSV